MPLVTIGRERTRSVCGALGRKGVQVQQLRPRLIAHILYDDAKEVRRARVGEIDHLDRILRAALRVDAPGHYAAGALLNQVQIVVVRRRPERIVPCEKDRDFSSLRQRDDVVRLRPEAEDVGCVSRLLEQVQMARIGDSADGESVDTRIDVGSQIVLVGLIAH